MPAKAHALMDRVVFRKIDVQESLSIFKEVDDLVERGKPIAVAKRHGHALKECAVIDRLTLKTMFGVDRQRAIESFQRLTARQKDSIENAYEASPNDPQILREYARFYALNKMYKNESRATELYEKAVKCATNDSERLPAKIDLINYTSTQTKDYKLKLEQLWGMLSDYENPEHKIDIRNEIAFCYMDNFHDFQKAYDVIEATLQQFETIHSRSSERALRILIKRLCHDGNARDQQLQVLLNQAKHLMAAFFRNDQNQ